MRQRLDHRIRRALEAPRFPERRDVDLAFNVSGGGEGIAFFDHFWLDATCLWAAGVQLARDGLDGSIAAAGQRQLLRALAAELKEPAAVADEHGRLTHAQDGALALLSLNTATGLVDRAARGNASCGGPKKLEPGGIQWLMVGTGPLPSGERVPVKGLQALVDQQAGPNARILAALHYKGASKRTKSTTLVVRNDAEAVADALVAVRAHLKRHSVDDADAAALELVLDELLTNQINYGFRDGCAHEILVEVDVELDRLTVEIRDDGVPFDPLSVDRPNLEAGIEERQLGGLGMHFVRSLVEDVSYRRKAGWNVVALGKRRTPKQGQPS